MIELRLKEMIANKMSKERRRITMTEIANVTGISRMTLNRMVRNRSYNTVTDHLDKLCTFFECRIEDLVRFVPSSNNKLDAA